MAVPQSAVLCRRLGYDSDHLAGIRFGTVRRRSRRTAKPVPSHGDAQTAVSRGAIHSGRRVLPYHSLAPHRDVATLCREGLTDTGIDPKKLRYEVGLSELGEWMNFHIYLEDSYSFTDAHKNKLDLRLECFNSVEGSSRLVILFGWFRFVCSNGLVIGETKIGSSVKSVGGCRLGQFTKCMIQRSFRDVEGPEAVGFPHGHLGLVVEALDDPA